MSDNEIFARIASDVADVGNSIFRVRDITIGMTEELYCKLFPREMPIVEGKIVKLFGCKVELIGNHGMRWIVGYAGTADEGET